jgi:hypothetical protein
MSLVGVHLRSIMSVSARISVRSGSVTSSSVTARNVSTSCSSSGFAGEIMTTSRCTRENPLSASTVPLLNERDSKKAFDEMKRAIDRTIEAEKHRDDFGNEQGKK